MSEKRRFDYGFAMGLALKLENALRDHCERILICGSLRRRKPSVADIELVYIPKVTQEQNPDSLLPELIGTNVTDHAIEGLIAQGSLAKRTNVVGREAWGPKNKLAVLVKSGVPVDL